MIKLNKRIAFYFRILIILGRFMLYVSRFLLYSSKDKADSIILLLGPDFNTHKKETYRLMAEGIVGYLIILAFTKPIEFLRKANGGHASEFISE